MNLEHYLQPFTLMGCLVIGYCLKHSPVSNRVKAWIPTLMAISGAIISMITISPTFKNAISGAISGLASTGVHQIFIQNIKKKVN